MADGAETDTLPRLTNGQSHAPAARPDAQGDGAFRRVLLFLGIVAASAGLAYALVRATLMRAPADPTTERIQSLIDEANRLLKQLDDKTA